MTSPQISLGELREAIDHDPFPEQQNFKMCAVEVLALVEAVEAAQRFTRTPADWSDEKAQTAYGTMMASLARFKDYA